MGQKVHPKGFRLSVSRNWDSRWYPKSPRAREYVREDYAIRSFLEKKLRLASVSHILIERANKRIRVKIFTARPGIIIGRKGIELEKLKTEIATLTTYETLVDIQEIKRPDLVAKVVAESLALQLERRVSFRRAMKKTVQTCMAMGADGIRVQCSGRLGGAEIARKEEQRKGRVPLHTLREDIDYGLAEAFTIYGVIGVKCWICRKKGDGASI